MRLAPLVRRPLAVLAATALLSTGGVATGLLVGTAFAADEAITSVSPTFARNSDSGPASLTFTAAATPFTPGATVVLKFRGNPSITVTNMTPTTVDSTRLKLTGSFDLRQQAPGVYDVNITNQVDVTQAAPQTYACTACFTLTGFQPTVTGFSRDSSVSTSAISPDYFRATGSNFARGATVTFEKGGVADPGVVFTTVPANSVTPPFGQSADNPNGKNPTGTQLYGNVVVTRTGATPALGGAHDVVLTNTDGRRGVCVSCFIVPRIDSVTLSGQTVGTQLALGRGVTNKDVIVKGDGFLAPTAGSPGTVAKFHTPGDYSAAGPTTVNSTAVLDSQTLRVNISIATSSTTGSIFQDLSLSNPDGAYETFANALLINARPKFASTNPVDRQNPGVASSGVVLTLTGTAFQPGGSIAFSPPDGITVNSYAVTNSTTATVNVSIAAGSALTARAITITNPDFGTTAGDTTASITPSAAPTITSASPSSVSRSPSAPTTVAFQLNGSGLSQQSLNGSTTNSYQAPSIIFPDDPTIIVGPATVNTSSPAGVRVNANITLPTNAAPGPRRVQFMDKNFSLVECNTGTGSACFTIDSIGVLSATTPLGNSYDTNDRSTTLNIQGSGFEIGATVKLVRAGQGDIPGTGVTVVNAGVLTATFDLREAPPCPGTSLCWSVRVTNLNGSTGICVGCFGIVGAQPHFISVSPSSAPAGTKSLIVTITGTDFARGAALVFNACGSATCNPVVVSSRLIDRQHYEFTLDTTNALPGPRNLQVQNADNLITPATECVGCFNLTAAPTVTSISPTSRAAGSPVVDVTVTGTNFNSNPPNGSPTVIFSGTGITYGATKNVNTTDPTANTFVVPVTVAPGAELTSRSVTVRNGDGGTASCSCTFTVKPAMTVTSIAPTSAPIGGARSVTITGTGFDTGAGNVSVNLGGAGVTVTNAVATTSTTITADVAVAAGTARGVRNVVVTNTSAGNGSTATLPSAFTLADVPTKPLSLVGTRGNTKADLTWSAPADTGGSPISAYTVTVTRSSDGSAVTTATITYPTDRSTTGASVTNLVNGTAYTFTVTATNGVGTGPASDPAANVKPATVPDPPTGAAATAGDASAAVSWTAPANTGGEPVTGYTVTATPGGATATVGGAARSATVAGLTNGTAYTFTVKATNLIGDSGPSNTTNAVTPSAQLPGAPTGVTANADAAAGSVSLTWTAPPAVPSAPVTSYTVRVTKTSDGSAVPGATIAYPTNRTTPSATVSGLTNGTQYSFVVAATNSVGTGPNSAAATETPYDVPGAVGNLAGTAGDRQITLTWTAPASNGGRSVTSYTATLSPGGATQTVSALTATFTGLTNGTDYTASVVATNLRGSGPAVTAGPFRPTAPQTAPSAPQSPSATAGRGSATVTWTAPASDGGSAITSYTVTSSPGGITKTVAGNVLTATVTGLTNGTAYTFTVVATNAVGNSPASAPTNAVTPSASVPTAPRNFAAVPGDGSATLTWTAPADDGGSPITSYTVTVSPNDGTVVYPSDRTQTGATVSGLTNGTTYTYSVIATNARGNSPAATTSATTPVSAARFVGLAPSRILDTRNGTGAPASAVDPLGVVQLQVLGRGGVPATGVSAVVMNVTVTAPTSAGYLTAYPNGTTRPTASNLNFVKGKTVPNLVVVPVGADGKVALFNGSQGTVHLLADVAGYYTAGSTSAPGAFGALAPSRLLDTRNGTGAIPFPVAAKNVLQLQVNGRGGVPSSGVSAVVLNVTVTAPTSNGYLTVYPNGTTRPTASNLNFVKGLTVPNLVIVPVGADGKVAFFNGSAGTVHLIADVAGYFTAGTPTTAGSFAALAPSRVLDTRNGTGAPQASVSPLGEVQLQVTGRGGVPATGVSAVVMNVTVTGPTSGGYITAYPNGTTRPTASNLNFVTGQTVPNLVVVPVGADGKVALFNGSQGNVHLLADVAGYYLS